MKNSIKILLTILGLNLALIFVVLKTFAFYSDTETSLGNTFSAGTLDFSLQSAPDFSPEVTPTASSSRSIDILNNGTLSFQYTVSVDNATGSLCNYLNLTAILDGNQVYSDALTTFSYNAGEFSTSTDNWQFIASLNSNDPSLQNATCTFDFVFNGVQIGGSGFSDQETISNTVTSGTWVEPTPPTTSDYSPIADAFVDEKNPGSNHGGDKLIEIRSKTGDNSRIFIKFDFHFPAGTMINSAFLKLYMKDAPSSSRTYEARRVLGDWKEKNPDGINWNNQPSVAETPTDSILSGTTNNVWLSWNVTSDVQGFVSGTQNYGWRLSDSIESATTSDAYAATFHSRESDDKDKRPMLEVTFVPPPVTTNHLVINEVYYNVAEVKGRKGENEWVEIYNPTDSPVNISGWQICDNHSCDDIPTSSPIPPKGFAVITNKPSTWDYWSIPDGVVKIALDSPIGNGLADGGDRIILKDASGMVVDAMSYGDDETYFKLPPSGKGDSLARIVKGYDTDSATDWIINATPNPGTNPSVDGVEKFIFTPDGVIVEGGETIQKEDKNTEEKLDVDVKENESSVEEALVQENKEEMPVDQPMVVQDDDQERLSEDVQGQQSENVNSIGNSVLGETGGEEILNTE